MTLISQGETTSKLAYFDTFNGLLPCRVVQIDRDAQGRATNLHFVLTAGTKHGAYRRGERLSSSPTWVCPRDAIYKRRGEFFRRILPYSW